MKKDVEVIVVIPVGPGCMLSFIADTIESYIYYSRHSYQFIIADDSHRNTGAHLKLLYPDIEVVATSRPMGRWGGLYITLSHAFRYALKHYNFKVLLRMDTDALVIGRSPETVAINFFTKNPHIGIAGQYPFDYNGNPWN